MSYTKSIFLEQGLTSVQTVSSGGSLSTGAAVAANGASNLTNFSGGILAATWSARLVGGFGSTPTQGNQIQLYLAPLLDGTNPSSFDTTTPYGPPGLLAGAFNVQLAQTSAQDMDLDPLPFPLSAYDYKPYLINLSGQTLSSGWTLTFYPTVQQYT